MAQILYNKKTNEVALYSHDNPNLGQIGLICSYLRIYKLVPSVKFYTLYFFSKMQPNF